MELRRFVWTWNSVERNGGCRHTSEQHRIQSRKLTQQDCLTQILKDGTKHACRSCITGHRSSKCVHHDRELFPIAKKGRPSTQCKACKQRGSAHSGPCECQNKRKTNSHAPGVGSAGASASGSGGYPEGLSSRKDSCTSQSSSIPPSESSSYAHMLPYSTGEFVKHNYKARALYLANARGGSRPNEWGLTRKRDTPPSVYNTHADLLLDS